MGNIEAYTRMPNMLNLVCARVTNIMVPMSRIVNTAPSRVLTQAFPF